METGTYKSYPVVQQTLNNSTGWIGKFPGDNMEIVRGQTFVAEEGGDIDAIEIWPNMISANGLIHMSLHTFDPVENKWGPEIDSSVVELDSSDAGKWVAFNMHGLHLHRGRTYGFLMGSDGSCFGIAEAVWGADQQLRNKGQEWKFVNKNSLGDTFSYFSLAFKIDLRA